MGFRCTVCVILEGSYPYITGGVSAWVQDLITNLPDIAFTLLTISALPDQTLRYELPDNVVGHSDILLVTTGGRRRVRKPRDLVRRTVRSHDNLDRGLPFDLEQIVASHPVGYSMAEDAVGSRESWELIARRNDQRDPVYPFSEYFWSWKSTHDGLFSIVGAEIPEADIYHAISTGYAGLAGSVAHLRTGRPLLLTEHGLYHKEREMEIMRAEYVRGYKRDMWTRMFTQLSRITYGYSAEIIALFEHNRRLQIELGAPRHKTSVIPNGIDVERFTVERVERPGFHVALVGRVVPIKDIKTFILAAKIVNARVPDLHVHCVGPTDEDPGYYADCERLVASLDLQQVFEFTGRQDVLEYYSFIDVLMLTSIREAQPLVILEAYAAGVPVVSTRVGNVPELLDFDERFLADQKDAEKLASGVLYLHDHPDERRNLVAQNRDTVERFYEKSVLHRSYADLYQRHLSRPPDSSTARNDTNSASAPEHPEAD